MTDTVTPALVPTDFKDTAQPTTETLRFKGIYQSLKTLQNMAARDIAVLLLGNILNPKSLHVVLRRNGYSTRTTPTGEIEAAAENDILTIKTDDREVVQLDGAGFSLTVHPDGQFTLTSKLPSDPVDPDA